MFWHRYMRHLRSPTLLAFRRHVSSFLPGCFGGVTSNKARAALVSLLQYFDPQRVHAARQAPERDLRQWIADAIATYGLTTATSWDITGGQVAMHHGGGASAKAVPPTPGQETWVDTFEVGSSAHNLSCGLGIPPFIRIGIYSDSTLTMYWGKQRGAALTSFHEVHPHYRLHQKGSLAGRRSKAS